MKFPIFGFSFCAFSPLNKIVEKTRDVLPTGMVYSTLYYRLEKDSEEPKATKETDSETKEKVVVEGSAAKEGRGFPRKASTVFKMLLIRSTSLEPPHREKSSTPRTLDN